MWFPLRRNPEFPSAATSNTCRACNPTASFSRADTRTAAACIRGRAAASGRHPGEAGFHPDQRQIGEALAEAVDHPIGAVDDVVPGESECMDGDEAVAALEAGVAPIHAGVEGDGEPAFLN